MIQVIRKDEMGGSIHRKNLYSHCDQISAGTVKANHDLLLLLLVIVSVEDLMLKIEIKTGLV